MIDKIFPPIWEKDSKWSVEELFKYISECKARLAQALDESGNFKKDN